MNESITPERLFPTLDSLESILWPGLALVVFVVTAVFVDVMGMSAEMNVVSPRPCRTWLSITAGTEELCARACWRALSQTL